MTASSMMNQHIFWVCGPLHVHTQCDKMQNRFHVPFQVKPQVKLPYSTPQNLQTFWCQLLLLGNVRLRHPVRRVEQEQWAANEANASMSRKQLNAQRVGIGALMGVRVHGTTNMKITIEHLRAPYAHYVAHHNSVKEKHQSSKDISACWDGSMRILLCSIWA